MAVPLTSRPLDLALYPTALIPSVIRGLPKLYSDMSGDPLISGVMGYLGEEALSRLVWFKTFLAVEAVFQLPVFVLGLRGLWTGSRSIYVLLLIYAASTATTTLPCLSVLLTTPVSSSPIGVHSITPFQRLLLLSSYVPFFLIPLVMTVDMAFRVLRLVKAGEKIAKERKSH